jgi:XTP/dITP diphosphohydrolase
MELVFATANAHKLGEVQQLVGEEFKLKSLTDIGCTDEIPETGNTFNANASQKSNYIYSKYKLDCFSDDSGLEIDALNGEPGVYSAHYANTRNAETNMQLVLDKMKGISNRKANFRCVISLILNGEEHFFEGTVNGTILTQRSGADGFGYDPIFVPDGYSESFAEMSAGQKNEISHRGRAIEKLLEFLNTRS